MRRRQANQLSTPFAFLNPYRVGAGPRPVAVAIIEIGDGYMCVEYQLGVSQLVAFAIKRDQIGGRYVKLDELVPPHATALKAQGLQFGATLEAIQLLGQVTPLSKYEEGVMAQTKLAKPAGPDKEALKAAAKAAPAGKKTAAPAAEPTKRRGNPEALAAARAAKVEGPDKRKITVLVKENPHRADTGRGESFAKVLKAKTVQDYKDAGGAPKYLPRWEESGHISIA